MTATTSMPAAPETAPSETAPSETAERAKTRACLRCRTPFESHWAGERVCAACKGTNSWKRGEMARSIPTRGSHARSSRGES